MRRKDGAPGAFVAGAIGPTADCRPDFRAARAVCARSSFGPEDGSSGPDKHAILPDPAPARPTRLYLEFGGELLRHRDVLEPHVLRQAVLVGRRVLAAYQRREIAARL